MKKRYIIIIILIVLVIMTVGGWFLYNQIIKKGREYEIQKISVENYEYFILRQEDKYGIIDKNGDIVIDCEYENVIIPNPQKAVLVCYDEKDNTVVLNQNKEQILTEYENIQPIRLKNIASTIMYEKNILIFEREGKRD